MRVPQSVSVRSKVRGTAGGCLSRPCPVLHVPVNFSEPWSREAEAGDQGRDRCRCYRVLALGSTIPHPEMPLCYVWEGGCKVTRKSLLLFMHGKGKGPVERGLLDQVKLGKRRRTGHGDVSLACFSSWHLPFQKAGSQVTAAPKGAGTVGCCGATRGAGGVLTRVRG